MTNYEIAEIVYALRLFINEFEQKELSDKEQRIANIGYSALQLADKKIHEIANQLESEEDEI